MTTPPDNTEAIQIQRAYYATTARQYDQMHLVDKEHNLALEMALAAMQQHGLRSILDVGCGTGRGVKFFLDRDLEASGVEPVRALLDAGIANHNIPAQLMVEASGEALPFADRSFDASIELGVLHHVPTPHRVVSEMARVTRRAIFISDSNRFGQGRYFSRLIKVAAWKLGLWPTIDFIRTRGKGYTISEEDGLAYSYSVYDNFDQLHAWADTIHVLPTSAGTAISWLHPLLTSSHALLIAIRNTHD